MTSWLRANWLNALVVVALIGTVSGWMASAHYRGVAQAEAASNERLEEERDAARTAAELARQESDRVIAETERQRARDSATIASLEARDDSLELAIDSLTAAAEAEAEAHDGFVTIQTHRAVVAQSARRHAVTDSLRLVERSGRLQAERTVTSLRVTVSALTADVGALEKLGAGKDRQIAALELAAGSSLFELDVDAGVWAGIGIVIGYAAGRASR